MKNDQKFTVEGYVTEELPGTKFKVMIKVGDKEHEIVAYLSGKMRMNYIKILEGDRVKVEMTPYDLTQGRITFREKIGGGFPPAAEKDVKEDKKEAAEVDDKSKKEKAKK